MTKEEIEENKVVKLCYDHLDKFTDIYPKDKNADGLRWENKMPENVKLTVYCKGTNDEGFLVNMTSEELGLEALIAQKWIIHSELAPLAVVGQTIQEGLKFGIDMTNIDVQNYGI